VQKNIVPHKHTVSKQDREAHHKHLSKVIWFTGLSGSGKSTLANELEKYLFKKGISTYILDGDNVRSGLNSDLDFSPESRSENIRRISEVSKLFMDAGLVAISAFISPLNMDRDNARKIIGQQNFIEVFVDCPLEVCEDRDVKGLYAKARKGLIPNFTGISAPFDKPKEADIVVDTSKLSLEEATSKLVLEILPKISLNEKL